MRSTITLTGLLCVAVLGLCGIPRAAHARGCEHQDGEGEGKRAHRVI